MTDDQDRRQFPRVHSQIAAEVSTPAGQTVPVTVLNLSRVGLQLGCDANTAASIVPPGHRSYPEQAISIEVGLTLPFTSRRPVRVVMKSRAVYCQASGEGNQLIGVEFVDFDADGYQLLEGFIVECMRHA